MKIAILPWNNFFGHDLDGLFPGHSAVRAMTSCKLSSDMAYLKGPIFLLRKGRVESTFYSCDNNDGP